jgi:hypothetical protein
MYEKMLMGRRILYFRHAPPFTDLDDVSSRDTQPPFENAPGFQCSVYYYWWAFLRESNAYKACCNSNGGGPLADIYSYFGDVRGSDFMRWWRFGGHQHGQVRKRYSGRSLFSEAVRHPMKVVISESDLALDRSDCVTLSIPITTDLSRMTAEFQQLMRPLVEDRIRQFGEPRNRALFEVTSSNPSLRALHKVLDAWQTKEAFPELKRYELAEKLGIAAKIDGARGNAAHESAVYTTLSRLLKKAEVLIRNVERGRFPDHIDYEKVGKVPELPLGLQRLATARLKAGNQVVMSVKPT